jgi:molybdenum cofactor guanylyltransferase
MSRPDCSRYSTVWTEQGTLHRKTRMQVPTYILAGGHSSRFGSDKARYVWRGKTLLERVAASLQPVASRLIVVTDREDKYVDLGFDCITDLHSELGPLGGLYAALTHAEEGLILCTACDQLGIRTAWLQKLLARRSEDADAVAFRSDIWHPFPGLYHSRIAARIRSALNSDRHAIWHVLESVHTNPLDLPGDWEQSVDVNIPDALERLSLKG